MKIEIDWQRTFVASEITTLDVSDGATNEQIEETVLDLLRSGGINPPSHLDAVLECGFGFINWYQVDDDEEEVPNGMRGDFEE
jgi:hypothetical protein